MRTAWVNTQKISGDGFFTNPIVINDLNYINLEKGTSLTLISWQLNFNSSRRTLDINALGDTSSYEFTQEKRHAGKHHQHPEVSVAQAISRTPGRQISQLDL